MARGKIEGEQASPTAAVERGSGSDLGTRKPDKDLTMSRIGKKPIPVPSGVKYSMEGNVVTVEGPKGKMVQWIPDGIRLELKDGHLLAERENDSQAAIHGLARALVSNAVEGVTKGWTQDLDIVGIGYRAELKGKNTVVFTLGYSHPIEFPLPTGITATIDPKQTRVTVSGVNRQQVGQVAADMRSLRKPDPYKNKGVRYANERLKKKVGKTGAK
jgi:large subunit ribosomal protein L6